MAFEFKSFAVHHDRSTMKVGTDAILLGTWASHPEPRTILDVGTGCGVIALMLAQRFPTACVHAIEPHMPSVLQARENIASSPWADRVTCFAETLQSFAQSMQYDLIVCNPPFFHGGPLPPQASRRDARHTTRLPWTDLCLAASRLLTKRGTFCVVLPHAGKPDFHASATATGLHLERHCEIRGLPDRPVRRTLLQYGSQPTPEPIIDQLTIERRRHEYTPRYAALTGNFLLRTPDSSELTGRTRNRNSD